jgi:hypothetical protein
VKKRKKRKLNQIKIEKLFFSSWFCAPSFTTPWHDRLISVFFLLNDHS